MSRNPARLVGVGCFFIGVFFLAQAYTMAFQGAYIDCFREGGGCSLQQYGEPTLTSALYGTVLALLAAGTFYLGQNAFRREKRA